MTPIQSPAVGPPARPGPPESWSHELVSLLTRAAELAAVHDLDNDRFMAAAWNACLDAHPGMREQLVDKELRSQLKRLRKRGLVGQA
ncbi:MAG TPA: hypothetical protein VGO00_12810 [Kofleriaceae bacterium]|jgi:hypothetical protein|nr:hypothetical protein [Kofleriaceae bacterium]